MLLGFVLPFESITAIAKTPFLLQATDVTSIPYGLIDNVETRIGFAGLAMFTILTDVSGPFITNILFEEGSYAEISATPPFEL